MTTIATLAKPLVIAISSRALFDLSESHHIFETEGKAAFCRYQVENEDNILSPGDGYALVKKFLAMNQLSPDQPLVEVILLSQNSADTGLRVFNSIAHYQLGISRAAFTSGISPYEYIAAFGADLFLSANALDVRKALDAGYAAATILSRPQGVIEVDDQQLRIAFDGDAVLFSDEAEKIYQQKGLAAFAANEQAAAKTPLPGGPFKGFFNALCALQNHFDAAGHQPIRTALVTARSAPSHERVVRTLRAWGVRIDEAFFLGGLPKGKFLQAFDADIFFDDQHSHCESATQHVTTAHVPHGIVNQE